MVEGNGKTDVIGRLVYCFSGFILMQLVAHSLALKMLLQDVDVFIGVGFPASSYVNYFSSRIQNLSVVLALQVASTLSKMFSFRIAQVTLSVLTHYYPVD